MSYKPAGCRQSHAAARNAPRAKVSRLDARWVSSTRSPLSAKKTVCSPTTSPPRTACRPISLLPRSPTKPCRSVPRILGVTQPPNLRENFHQAPGGAAGRIFLEPVVHLDHFEVEVRPQDACRLPGQPEERIDTHAEVRRQEERDGFRCLPGFPGGQSPRSP